MRHASSFAPALKVERLKKGLSQAELAAKIDRDGSMIARLENGSRVPSREFALELADALELTGWERIAFLAEAGFAETEAVLAVINRLKR